MTPRAACPIPANGFEKTVSATLSSSRLTGIEVSVAASRVLDTRGVTNDVKMKHEEARSPNPNCFPTFRKVAPIGLSLAMLAGCDPDASGAEERDETAESEKEVPSRDEFAAPVSLYALGLDLEAPEVAEITNCGTRTVETPSGDEVEAPLEYRFGQMNLRLQHEPRFAEYSSLAEVTNCDEAEQFRDELEEYRLLARAAAEGESRFIEAREEITNGTKVKAEGVFPQDQSGAVKLLIRQVGASRAAAGCSGVLIGNSTLLTASHCFMVFGGRSNMQLEFQIERSSGAQGFVSLLDEGDSEWHRLSVNRHPEWSPRWPDHDLAVVYAPWGGWKNTLPTDFARISTDDVDVAYDPLIAYGYGPDEDGEEWGSQNRASARPSWMGDNEMRVTMRSQSSFGLCSGDSGGPAMTLHSRWQTPLLTAIAHAITPGRGDCADEEGSVSYWATVHSEGDSEWIRGYGGFACQRGICCNDHERTNEYSGEQKSYMKCWQGEAAKHGGVLEYGVDRFGGDYRSIELHSSDGPDACQRICQGESRCKAFAYMPAFSRSARTAGCWLKDEVTEAIDRTHRVSGLVRNHQYMYGVDLSGNEIDVSWGRSAEECRRRCIDNSRCKAFSFDAPNSRIAGTVSGTCRLRDFKGRESSFTGVTSGLVR